MEREHLLLVKLNKLYRLMPKGRDSQGRILRILSTHEGISQRKLREICGIKAGSLSEVLSKLEKMGYIEKKEDSTDKRKQNIYITDAGREAFDDIHEEHISEAKGFFDPLSEKEQEAFLDILNKMLEGKGDLSRRYGKRTNDGSFEA